jgi:hypothetical protein
MADEQQQQAPVEPPTAKHELCNLTIEMLTSPTFPGGALTYVSPCPACALFGVYSLVASHAPSGKSMK